MKFLRENLASPVLISLLVISIFTLLFAASISYKQFKTLADSEKMVRTSFLLNVELERLSSYAKDAEAAQRGFILTRDSSFLTTYHESLDKVNRTFVTLKLLTSGNEQHSRHLDTLNYLINQRFYFFSSVLNRNEIKVRTPNDLKKLIINGRDIMANSYELVDEMISSEMNSLRMRQHELEKNKNLSPFSILFIVLFSLFIFIVAYYKINRDLKAAAQVNNQLLINNEIFEHSEQIADISHWYWNIRQNTITYSNNLYRLLGCEPLEFEPTIENFLTFVHQDDRHLVMEDKKRTVQELLPSMTYFRVIRKDGALRHFKSIGKIINDNYGTNFSIGINADITDQYNKDKLIEEKFSDLERSNKQLSAFNHIASHDLQEPLRKVQIFLSRIREKNYEILPERIKDYFAGIEKSTLKMQMFIEDLLMYSRANKADKVFEITDLNRILEGTIQELSQRIDEKHAVIKSSSLLPTLSVIPFQIQQLFINIISNSIKYSKPDLPPVVRIYTKIVSGSEIKGYPGDPDAKFYKISFSDNGIGFSGEHAENIFTLFYRLHTDKEYSGTGVGLAICKIIVENHKGYITAEGIPGLGATIRVYLPA